MSEDKYVYPEHPLYNKLYRMWVENDRPFRLFVDGWTYLAVRDNDVVYFVREGLERAIYETLSFKR